MLNDDWKYDEPRKEYYFNDKDLEEHDKQIRAELIEELCNRHSDDNSWCEFTIDVIVAELEEIAQELKN